MARHNQSQSAATMPSSGLARLAWCGVAALAALSPLGVLGTISIRSTLAQQRLIAAKASAQVLAHERLLESPAEPTVELATAIKGRDIFANACVTCHGQGGTGVPGLGKNLATSDFIALSDDTSLHDFLVVGRPDAVPMGMPPKGGHDELTSEDLRALVVYMRGLQDSRRMPQLPALTVATPAEPTQADKDAALAAAGGDAELAEYIASGDKIYHTSCVACHGKAGAGMKGNGAKLADNAFVQSLDDDKLLAFIKAGRSPSDPANKTGVQMPPKGGNPAMSDDDVLDVIAYLRTLQPAGSQTGAAQGSDK